MVLIKEEQQRLKSLLSETIILLCKNGLNFHNEICIEGLIGITLDQEDIFLVNIKESIIPVDELDVGPPVPRDLDSVSTVSGPVSSIGVRYKRARDVQAMVSCSYDDDDDDVIAVKLNAEILAVDKPILVETGCSRACPVTVSVKGEENIRPALKCDTGYVDDCSATVIGVNVNVKGYLTSDVSHASAIPDHESSSTRPKKRRRLDRQPSEQKCATTSEVHNDIPATHTAAVSNISGCDVNILGNKLSECDNVKLEDNSGLIEITDDELSERGEDTLKGGSVLYSQYEGVYGSGGGATDEDIRGERYVPDSVRPWQLLDPHTERSSMSQQEAEKEYFPEEHLTTCSYCGQQFNEMSDLCSHKCPLNIKTVFKRTKSMKSFPRKLNPSTTPVGGHAGERPFQCGICKKSFTTLFNCQRHELIHTGERPFECMLCHKRFAQLANLRVHDRRHCKDLAFT